jgi:hypothetical protein
MNSSLRETKMKIYDFQQPFLFEIACTPDLLSIPCMKTKQNVYGNTILVENRPNGFDIFGGNVP